MNFIDHINCDPTVIYFNSGQDLVTKRVNNSYEKQIFISLHVKQKDEYFQKILTSARWRWNSSMWKRLPWLPMPNYHRRETDMEAIWSWSLTRTETNVPMTPTSWYTHEAAMKHACYNWSVFVLFCFILFCFFPQTHSVQFTPFWDNHVFVFITFYGQFFWQWF